MTLIAAGTAGALLPPASRERQRACALAPAPEPRYDRYAAGYDALQDERTSALSAALGLGRLRGEALAFAQGRVLEVAIGTGLSLRGYDARRVSSVTGIDASGGMLRRARARAANAAFPVRLVRADVCAERDDDDDDDDVDALPRSSFETAVVMFSLCTMAEPQRALRSMVRALRPGGTLVVLEHVRSRALPVAAYQNATAGAVARMSKGCRWNMDVDRLVAQDRLLAGALHIQRCRRELGGTIELLVAEKTGPAFL